ncbi:hypothetical protein TNCV_4364521 [Trichonephila clavipes]|nr:hypothetical protein TNCV_4364521 [Trichonephila clavipes]
MTYLIMPRPVTSIMLSRSFCYASSFSCPDTPPDLSLIEHIWDFMGRRLQTLLNVDDLSQQSETIWRCNSTGHRSEALSVYIYS